ncbi:MAG: hypothetical protein HY235_04075 [Acidobacteria bacterium]|nr:hypothetical protein [Acidobacteriota bacterium]
MGGPSGRAQGTANRMILAIADDLTGAAEIGGVACRHGLSAEVHLDHPLVASCDVMVMDANTRSLSPAMAASRLDAMAGELRNPGAGVVFKKTDSVMRGNVASEVTALARIFRKERVLLVPCNPSLGRTIADGEYWIEGRRIHQTDFRRDPEHPILSCDVRRMLGDVPVHVLRPEADLPSRGLILGEALDAEDIACWVRRLDERTLAAGAADFFAALLDRLGHRPLPRQPASRPSSVLLISGSASESSLRQQEQLRQAGAAVLAMPDPLYEKADAGNESWVAAVVCALETHRMAIASIARPVLPNQQRSARLAEALAHLAAQALARFPVAEMWLEGGATASAVIRHFGWRRLDVLAEMAPGAVRLRPRADAAPVLVMKPGSYQWPYTPVSGIQSAL